MHSLSFTSVTKMAQRKSYHAECNQSSRIRQAGLQKWLFLSNEMILKKIKLYNLILPANDSAPFSLTLLWLVGICVKTKTKQNW